LHYDQYQVMAAPVWLDEQLGTGCAARYLVPGELWERFSADKAAACELDRAVGRLRKLMDYCRRNFGAPSER
jgi:hypothetical protein